MDIDALEQKLQARVSSLSEIKDLDVYQAVLTEITYIVTNLYRTSEEYRDEPRTVH